MNIEFIIPTYKRPEQLMCTITSITSQYNPNWRIHVVADAIYDGYEKVKDFFKDNEKIKFSELNGPNRDWGHTPRNYGLENAKEEWIVMSGDDNYYMPLFVDDFLKVVDDNTHFVFCNMIHNWNAGQYIGVDSQPSYGKIDIGNFMTRTKLAQQLKLDTKINGADAKFVDDYLKKFKDGKITKIKKYLYVHN